MTYGSGYFKVNYASDAAILDTDFKRFWFIILIIGLLIFPFTISIYGLTIANLVLTAVIVALGLNILTGNTGLISIGHAGFACAGAFTAFILGAQYEVPFLLVLAASALVGAVLGTIAGLPSLRLRGVYLVLSTFAMQTVIVLGCSRYQAAAGLPYGAIIPTAKLGPWAVESELHWYFLLLAVVFIVTIFCINLLRSRVGRAFMAIRERDVAALVLGINIGFYKVLAFAFSAALASIAGTLASYHLGYADATEWTLWVSVAYIAMVIVGGMGSVLGSFLGAIFITLLPYSLSWIFGALNAPSSWMASLFAIQYSLYGFFIALFLLIEPLGLAGIWVRIRLFFQLWPFKFSRVISTTR